MKDKYIPDFTYEVIRPHDYTNQQLMEKNDEMGLIMLLNKLQSLEDFKGISVWKDSQENILKEKKIFQFISPSSLCEFYLNFRNVLSNNATSSQNYAMVLQGQTCYFTCTMQCYNGMVLCQCKDATQKCLEQKDLAKRNKDLFEILQANLLS